jgi:hypothetical protein
MKSVYQNQQKKQGENPKNMKYFQSRGLMKAFYADTVFVFLP